MASEEKLFARLSKAIIEGYTDEARELAKEALDAGIAPLKVVDDGMLPGIQEVGRLYECGDYFLPELMMSAEAMQAALDVVEPALKKAHIQRESAGIVVIGTVAGDIHDIGKSIVATMLSANGFDVYDLGTEVTAHQFLEKAGQVQANILAMSALLPTTMPYMQRVIESAQEAGVREGLKIMVGGAPVTQAFAQKIGADGYADDAAGAVRLARQLMGK
jgi:corrinoid protein of di/trimethylamine methyltransferase